MARRSVLPLCRINSDSASQVFYQSALAQNTGGQFISGYSVYIHSEWSTSTTDLTKNLSQITVTAANSAGSSNTLTVPIP